MADIKTNIDKIVDELNFYMRQYPNTYSEVKHLLFEIEEQEQEIRNKAIDELVERATKIVYEANDRKINPQPRDMVADIHFKLLDLAEQMKGVR